MVLASYLPSSQFAVIVGALLISGGLVYGAERFTSPETNTPTTLSAQGGTTVAENWESALAQIQQESGVTVPEPISPDIVSAFLDEAQSGNLTTSVARSLFVTLSDAKSQGLGDDLPTQERLLTEALISARANLPKDLYVTADLTVTTQTPDSLHAYGNAVAAVPLEYPDANWASTYDALGQATGGSVAHSNKLKKIGADYAALAQELSQLPVPKTLTPLHLAAINNFAATAETYKAMATISTDPVRGLAGMAQYQVLQDEAWRIFTNIAEALQKGGILFTKDEPGSAWSAFLSSP